MMKKTGLLTIFLLLILAACSNEANEPASQTLPAELPPEEQSKLEQEMLDETKVFAFTDSLKSFGMGMGLKLIAVKNKTFLTELTKAYETDTQHDLVSQQNLDSAKFGETIYIIPLIMDPEEDTVLQADFEIIGHDGKVISKKLTKVIWDKGEVPEDMLSPTKIIMPFSIPKKSKPGIYKLIASIKDMSRQRETMVLEKALQLSE